MTTTHTPVRSLPAPLLEAADLVTTMEQSVADEHWEQLPSLAEAFRHCLLALQLPLAEAAGRRDPDELAALQASLGEVLGRHQAMLGVLEGARDRTAAELEGAVQGHHGANQYLLAAGGA